MKILENNFRELQLFSVVSHCFTGRIYEMIKIIYLLMAKKNIRGVGFFFLDGVNGMAESKKWDTERCAW